MSALNINPFNAYTTSMEADLSPHFPEKNLCTTVITYVQPNFVELFLKTVFRGYLSDADRKEIEGEAKYWFAKVKDFPLQKLNIEILFFRYNVKIDTIFQNAIQFSQEPSVNFYPPSFFTERSSPGQSACGHRFKFTDTRITVKKVSFEESLVPRALCSKDNPNWDCEFDLRDEKRKLIISRVDVKDSTPIPVFTGYVCTTSP